MVQQKEKGTFNVKLVKPFKQIIIILIKYNRYMLSPTQALMLLRYKKVRGL